MPPIDKPVSGETYDVVFIGGGSGGSAGSVCNAPYIVMSNSYHNVHSVALRSMVPRLQS
jgi:hypothetical protein